MYLNSGAEFKVYIWTNNKLFTDLHLEISYESTIAINIRFYTQNLFCWIFFIYLWFIFFFSNIRSFSYYNNYKYFWNYCLFFSDRPKTSPIQKGSIMSTHTQKHKQTSRHNDCDRSCMHSAKILTIIYTHRHRLATPQQNAQQAHKESRACAIYIYRVTINNPVSIWKRYILQVIMLQRCSEALLKCAFDVSTRFSANPRANHVSGVAQFRYSWYDIWYVLQNGRPRRRINPMD